MKITIHDIAEFFGCVVTLLLFVLLAWIYLIVTPDQMSAEYDKAVEEAEKACLEIGGAL